MENTVEFWGSNIIKLMDTLENPKIGAYRIYYQGRVLMMKSRKCQWTMTGAAKNALHNMIDEVLYIQRDRELLKRKDEIYNYILSKVEIRQVNE